MTHQKNDHDKSSSFASPSLEQFGTFQKTIENFLDGIKKQWKAFQDRVDTLIKKAEHLLNSDGIWSSICEWWTDTIKDAIKKVRQLQREIIKKIDKIIDVLERSVKNGVPILSLFDSSLKYATEVLPLVSDLGNNMLGSGKIDSWRGPAKLTYEKRVADQIQAVKTVTGNIKDISAWLNEVAVFNTKYIADIGGHISNILGVLTTLLIDLGESVAGAITQAPLALQDFSDFIGTVVSEILQCEMELVNRVADVSKAGIDLANIRYDYEGLPSGKWRQSVNR